MRGNAKFQMQDPADVAVHGDDVYVADTWNGRVQHLTTSGQFRDTAADGFYGPRGVAVGPDGKVWVTDSGNNRIAIVQAGQPTRFVGKTGAGADGLSSPVGVAVSASGRVYVADIGNHRIQVLGADGKFERHHPGRRVDEPHGALPRGGRQGQPVRVGSRPRARSSRSTAPERSCTSGSPTTPAGNS